MLHQQVEGRGAFISLEEFTDVNMVNTINRLQFIIDKLQDCWRECRLCESFYRYFKLRMASEMTLVNFSVMTFAYEGRSKHIVISKSLDILKFYLSFFI